MQIIKSLIIMRNIPLLLSFFFGLLVSCVALSQERRPPVHDSIKAIEKYKLAKEHTYNNPALGKKYAREAALLAVKANNQRLEAASKNTLGLCHRNLSEYDSAITAFSTSAKLFRNIDITGYGNARNNLSMTLFYLGKYEEANILLLEVIKEAEEHNLYKVLSNAYQNLGIVNNTQERYRDALNNFILAEKYHDLSGDARGKAGAAINQAFIYFKHLKQYNKAIAIYKKIIPLKQQLKDEKGVGICYNNLAEIYLIREEYDKALHNINKAIAIRHRINDQYGLTSSYPILADIYYGQKKYAMAEKYAAMAVDVAKKIGAKKEYSDALKLLAKTQEANRDIASAYSNYVNAVKIKDSLLNRENFARMAELETKYETEKKEREILMQRTKIAENQLKIDQKNMVIFGAFSLAIIAILAGYLFFNRQKLKTIKLEKEAELKDALLFIETQNKLQEQRLQISRDLHDNIGSQLTFIISSLDNLKYSFEITNAGLKNKIGSIRNFTRDTITELRDTIWAMNKEEITLQDLDTRISNFIENAKAASKGIGFTFTIDSRIPESVAFSSLKGINLYRIIQESVNNALKHAAATNVQVTISKDASDYMIKIKDNGKGFEPDDAAMGNGLANIKKRAKECGGELAVISAPGEGTEIIFTFK